MSSRVCVRICEYGCVCTYIYICMFTHFYLNFVVWRERERETERARQRETARERERHIETERDRERERERERAQDYPTSLAPPPRSVQVAIAQLAPSRLRVHVVRLGPLCKWAP